MKYLLTLAFFCAPFLLFAQEESEPTIPNSFMDERVSFFMEIGGWGLISGNIIYHYSDYFNFLAGTGLTLDEDAIFQSNFSIGTEFYVDMGTGRQTRSAWVLGANIMMPNSFDGGGNVYTGFYTISDKLLARINFYTLINRYDQSKRFGLMVGFGLGYRL